MGQSKPAKRLRVSVPRHNSHSLGGKLHAAVEALAKERGIRLQNLSSSSTKQSEIGQAIESASDWNSLLATARAQRGPQWDVGTQQFLVDKESELFYDPTPLFETLGPRRPRRDSTASRDPDMMRERDMRDMAYREREMMMRQQRGMDSPQRQHQPHPHHINTHMAPGGYQYGSQGSPRPRPFGPGGGGAGGGGSFYNDRPGGMNMNSPGGGMGYNPGMSPTSEYQGSPGGRNMGLGMPPNMMRSSMSPEVRRSARVARGIDDLSMPPGYPMR